MTLGARVLTTIALALALAAPADAAESRDHPLAAAPAGRALQPAAGTPAAPLATVPTAAPLAIAPCPKLQPDALCGHVDVPFDRSQPDGAKIAIAFVLLPRTDPSQSALEPIFVILGGPGEAASANTNAAVYDFGPARARRDIVLVDYRGEGRSDPIDCSLLQHLQTDSAEDVISAAGACGAHLGDASDRYGAADVADDVDAVRAALGYRTIDLDGLSYGTVHAQAYALRHRDHLRALILDGAISPFDVAGSWMLGISNAEAVAGDVALVCQHSQSCSQENPDPAASFAALDARLRRQPIDGIARDVNGTPHSIHFNEGTLIRVTIAESGDFFYTNDGELPAAAAALDRGDPAPLLRIAANTPGPLFGDGGDPAAYSAGVNAATQCSDFPVPWDLSASFAQRRAQFEAAIARRTFGPFSPDAWANNGGFSGYCLKWPAPNDLTHVFTGHPTFPGVPVLVVAASLDIQTTVAQNRFVAREFPHSRLVLLRNGQHVPGFFAGCIPDIYARFLSTLDAGDTSCVHDDDPDRPAVGSFARHISEAPPATPQMGDHSTDQQRRLATIGWATVQDALRQSFRLPNLRGTGVGLRGGSFKDIFNFTNGVQRVELHGLQFSDDVAVDGHVEIDNGQLSGTLTVRAPGVGGGLVTLGGRWFTFGTDAGVIHIKGRLGGHTIALTTPAG